MRVIQKYIDYALIWDIILSVIVGAIIVHFKPILSRVLILPTTAENLNNFCISLITVSATLLGFLLTVITIIVTFSKAFTDKKEKDVESPSNNSNSSQDIPTTTVFEKKSSKEDKFYGTHIHVKVADVFVMATYEIALILFVLIIIQFNVINYVVCSNIVISASMFFMLLLAILRCLFVFKLFLNVHLRD